MQNKLFQAEYQKLNSAQKEAVDSIWGPVMVIAGPGTGKTQIIAMRIANILLKEQINPSNILCLTFTNSGVHSMKKRLLKIIGPSSYKIHVATFHTFCNEIILYNPEKFLFNRKLEQATELEQIQIIQKIIDDNDFQKLKPLKKPYHYQSVILSAISKLKQEDINAELFLKKVKQAEAEFYAREDIYHEKGEKKGELKAKFLTQKENLLKNYELALIYKNYQKNLQAHGLYDFSDMILFVLKAFNKDPDLLSQYQEKYQFILVDEYQDTNSAQNEIVKLLGSFDQQSNVFVVGDDDQSIFRFQGASLENILFFKRQYIQSKIIVLEENYRSGQKILDAAQTLIQNNTKQISKALQVKKNLKSRTGIEAKILLAGFSNYKAENYYICKKIEELIKTRVDLQQIACIFRDNRDGQELAEILSKLNIPYQISSDENILDDLEIKKLIKILKVINLFEKTDDQTVFEIMHYPFFNLSIFDIYNLAQNASHKESILKLLIRNKISDLENPLKCRKFAETMLKLWHFAQNNTFAQTVEEVINQTGYLNYLLALKDSPNHLNRLRTLFDEIKLINSKNKDLSIGDFLKYIDDLYQNDLKIVESKLDANFNGVNLLTAHKSKGLEFEYVFITKLYDGHWGNKTLRELIRLPQGLLKIERIGEDENDEEERRLFYVALTRAKKQIFLTYSEDNSEQGQKTLSVPSKFINELDQKLIDNENVEKYEKSYSQRLNLNFAPKIWEPSNDVTRYLEKLVEDFTLSPTSLNAYLDCPKAFLYNQILKVPKIKNFSLALGSAVHRGLELFFKQYKNEHKIPTSSELFAYFNEALSREILLKSDYLRALKIGGDDLIKYYEFSFNLWQKSGPPLELEYNFDSHKVKYDEVPITGKLDKLEMLDSISRTVKIIDYKTSKPKSLNEIMGKTAKKDTSLLYQAYFYNLLAQKDKQFNYKVGEIVFEFLTPEKDKFKHVCVPIDKDLFEEFLAKVKDVYLGIKNLNFEPNYSSCEKNGQKCEYYDFCHMKEDDNVGASS